MSNVFHQNFVDNDNHAVTARSYADITARDADLDFQIFTNVNKLIRVDSPASYYVLVSVGPTVFQEFSSTLTDSFLELTDTPSSYSGEGTKVVSVNAGETALEFTVNAGGDVFGPGTSTNDALVRFDLATGKLIQNSLGILSDAGALSGLTKLNVDNLQLDLDTLTNTATGNSVILESDAIATVVVKSTGGTPRAKVNFDNGLDINGIIGDFGGGINTGASHAQIGWGDTANLFLAPGLNAAGDIVLYTPDSGVTTLIERLRIKTSTGSALFGTQMSIGALTAPATDTSLDLKATDRAFLFNRLDSTARDALTPLAGMGIWNTTTVQMENFDGVAWVPMGGGDVSGPATNLDNSIPTWNGVDSKLLQDQGTMFITDAGLVGIGIAAPDSLLHSHIGTSGAIAAITGTNLTLESNTNQYLSFLTPTANFAAVVFGNETDNDFAGIYYDTTNGFQFRNAGNLTRVCIEEDGDVGIGVTSPEARLHVQLADAGAASIVGGVTLAIESNTNNFIHFLQPNANGGGILFGDPDLNVAGAFSYGANDSYTWSTVTNAIKMTLDSTGHLRIGDATAPTAGLDVQGSHANKRTTVADADYTILADDYLIALTSITAPRTITFSDAEIAKTGKEWPIKDESGSVDGTDTITLATASAQTIDNATSLELNTAFFDLVIYTDGSNLFVRSG